MRSSQIDLEEDDISSERMIDKARRRTSEFSNSLEVESLSSQEKERHSSRYSSDSDSLQGASDEYLAKAGTKSNVRLKARGAGSRIGYGVESSSSQSSHRATSRDDELAIRESFIDALNDDDLADRVRSQKPRTMEAAYHVALFEEFERAQDRERCRKERTKSQTRDPRQRSHGRKKCSSSDSDSDGSDDNSGGSGPDLRICIKDLYQEKNRHTCWFVLWTK